MIRFRCFLLICCIAFSCCLGGCTAEAPPPAPRPEAVRDEGRPVPPDRPGRWNPLRDRGGPAGMTELGEEMARLEAIGYVSGSREAGGSSGVTIHDLDRAGGGTNLYASGHGPEAVLMTMDGTLIHRWRCSSREIWPDADEPFVPKGGRRGKGKAKKMADSGEDTDFFRMVHLYPNGDLLAIFEGRGIVRMDRYSTLLWASRCGAHHDLDILPDGDLLVLTREARINPLVSDDKPILEDFITTLDAEDGRVKDRVSLVECFNNAPQFEAIWRSSENESGDIFHTNALFLLGEPAAGLPASFLAGRVLTSMRALNCVALVDLDDRSVVWAATGRFRGQHDPRLLASGRLLLFDNYGVTNRSRVLEMDLDTWRPVWSYKGTSEAPFYSETCGTAQRLGNGNTLITESDGGRAFEVTTDGTIVWEFWSPHRAGGDGQFIATLFAVTRLDPAFPVHWAGGAP